MAVHATPTFRAHRVGLTSLLWFRLKRAKRLLAAQRYDEALRKLEEMTQLRPNLVDPWMWIGIVHERCGRLEQAKLAYARGQAIVESGPLDLAPDESVD